MGIDSPDAKQVGSGYPKWRRLAMLGTPHMRSSERSGGRGHGGVAAVAALALSGALLVPSAASGAVTIGSDLANPGSLTTCGEDCTVVQFALPGRQVAAPFNGVIVRWRVRDSEGSLKLRVVRPAAGGQGTGVATSAPATANLGVIPTFDTRLPVSAGDNIGIDLTPDSKSGLRQQRRRKPVQRRHRA